jgi:hypothetical protein
MHRRHCPKAERHAAEFVCNQSRPRELRKDWEIDIKWALLTRFNQEITPEECTRRLRSLPKPARHDAYVIAKEDRLTPQSWDLRDYREEDIPGICRRSARAKRALANSGLPEYHVELQQEKATEWLNEEIDRWNKDMKDTVSLKKRWHREVSWEWRFRREYEKTLPAKEAAEAELAKLNEYIRRDKSISRVSVPLDRK